MVLSGCTTWQKVVRSDYNFAIFEPPFERCGPGALCAYVADGMIKKRLREVCRPGDPYAFAQFIGMTRGATLDSAIARKADLSVDLDVAAKDAVSANLNATSVRNVNMTLSNLYISSVDGGGTVRGTRRLLESDDCRTYARSIQARGEKIQPVEAVIVGTVKYKLEFAAGINAQVKADALQKISDDLKAEGKVGLKFDGTDTITGDSLYLGYRLDPVVLPPISQAGENDRNEMASAD